MYTCAAIVSDMRSFPRPCDVCGWHRCQVRLTSPTTCFVQIIATMQPHLPLPQSLINLGTRKLAGVFLYYLQV